MTQMTHRPGDPVTQFHVMSVSRVHGGGSPGCARVWCRCVTMPTRRLSATRPRVHRVRTVSARRPPAANQRRAARAPRRTPRFVNHQRPLAHTLLTFILIINTKNAPSVL